MNVTVTWKGTDITQHTIEYTRQHDICTGIGSLDLTVEGKTEFDFNPWDSIVISEEGSQVAKYNLSSVEDTAPGGTYVIAAQDNSKRLTDFFIDRQYTTVGITYTRYWIERILSDCGVVDYSINVDADDNGNQVTEGTQLGMQPAYDSIISLLQMSGWYMYFDADGVCQIGELDASKSPVHDFYSHNITQIRTTYSDKNLRNRVYVWGTFDEITKTWIAAKAETYLGWFRDDGEDYRSIVYQNSSILFYTTALELAEEILANFSNEVPEKEVEVIGAHPDTVVGSFIKIGGIYGTGIGQVSSYIVNMNSGGLTTTYIIDKKCPRLFGRTDIKGEYIYIGTNANGVYRKALKGGYWYPYNTNISTSNIKDLTAYKTFLSCVDSIGKFFHTSTGYWTQYTVPSGLLDNSTGQVVNTTSGHFIASSADKGYGTSGGITTVFATFPSSGFSYDGELPIYPPSGNRAWVVGLTQNGTQRYIQQIYYDVSGVSRVGGYVESGRIYDVAVLDLETNDVGKNLISVLGKERKIYGNGSFGNYTTFGQKFEVVGKNLYTTVPPPTQGNYVDADDYGGLRSMSVGSIQLSSTIYTNPSGYYMAATNIYTTGDNIIRITERSFPIGASFQENVSYDITNFTADQFLLVDLYTHRKLVKVNDDEYNLLIQDSDTSVPVLLKFRKSTGSVYGQVTYPSIKNPQNSTQEVPISQYNNNIVGGVGDGDYFVHGMVYHGVHTEANGFAAVRVINVRTGGYSDYIVNTPPFFLNVYNGGYWYMELVGGDETPNHFILAFAANMSGETEGMDSPPRHTKVYIFCVNKYTGQVNHSEYTKSWTFPGAINAWNGLERLVYYDSFVGGYTHRNPFFVCSYEHVEGGIGHALLHIAMVSTGKFWAWSYAPYIPYWFWGLWYYGTYTESAVLHINIPEAVVVYEDSFRDDDEGNPNTLPVVPENHVYNTPTWCYQPIKQEVISLYSRNLVPPLVFKTMRAGMGGTDCSLTFANPFNPEQHTHLTQSEFYFWNPSVGGGVMDTYDLTFHKMLDDVDNTIYLTHPSGTDTLMGLDTAGYTTKLYDYAHHGGGIWGNPTPIGNTITANDYSFQQFYFWPGSGIYATQRDCRILYHDPTVLPSGQFTTIFKYPRPLALETGYGLPTTIYDLPSSGQGEWQANMPTTVLGVSYSNASGTFATQSPNFNIFDARVFDVFNGSKFPLQSGETLPDNTLSRFVGVVNNQELLAMFNTEQATLPDEYSRIVTYSGYELSHVDFTNFFPSPYVFIAAYTTASGQMFLQRNTEQANFYPYNSNLPAGGRITIIRADDWI